MKISTVSLSFGLALLAFPSAWASGMNNLKAFEKSEICIGNPYAEVNPKVNDALTGAVKDALEKTSKRLNLGFEATPWANCAGYLRFVMWGGPAQDKLLYLARLELVVPNSQLGGVRSLTGKALKSGGSLEFSGVWESQDLGLLPSVEAARPLAVGVALELLDVFVADWKKSH